MKGVSLPTIQVLLGHSSPQMTQRYAHLAPSYVRDEVKKIDEALRERLAPAAKLTATVIATVLPLVS